MLKKTISFDDLDGNPCEETHYFNLSQSELARMEINETIIQNDTSTGGMRERIEKVVATGSGKAIMELFESLIKASYGVRSDDGRSFLKNDEQTDRFVQSMAYDQMFVELVTDANQAAEFIREVVPKKLANRLSEAENSATSIDTPMAPQAPAARIEQPVETASTSAVDADALRAMGLNEDSVQKLLRTQNGE